MKHESRRPDPWTLLSCILILALPAIILLKHHHYDYFAPESLMLLGSLGALGLVAAIVMSVGGRRSEEHTSELQSLMRISYAVFCLKKKKKKYSHCENESNND